MIKNKLKIPTRQPLYLALLIAFASTAAAQETTTEETKPVSEEVKAAEQQGAETAAENKSIVLDTVKVTAQSREQELKDVPISVTVLDASMIDNLEATNLGDLDGFVPGLEVSSGSVTQPRYAIHQHQRFWCRYRFRCRCLYPRYLCCTLRWRDAGI